MIIRHRLLTFVRWCIFVLSVFVVLTRNHASMRAAAEPITTPAETTLYYFAWRFCRVWPWLIGRWFTLPPGSDDAYPTQIATRLSLHYLRPVLFTNLTCTGAVTGAGSGSVDDRDKLLSNQVSSV